MFGRLPGVLHRAFCIVHESIPNMPSLIDIRRRIRAVKSTQQITKAMKMIAASRLRKAHDRIIAARPFSKSMVRVLSSLAGRVDAASHPLLAARDDREPGAHILLLIVTGDKGLAGGFNANVIRAAAQFIVSRHGQRVSLGLVGRKGRDFFRRRAYPVRLERTNLFARLEFSDAQRIFDALLPQYVQYEVFHALLESAAAEHAARMTAMDAATNNAVEIVDSLTLYMNKVRQAAITREIIEVVSGAESL